MGASIQHMVGLLSRQFVGLVLLAILIAVPLAGYAIHHWLEDYAYRINILMSWWVFVLAGVLAIAIALVTVTILAWRAAIANPVDSLRVE